MNLPVNDHVELAAGLRAAASGLHHAASDRHNLGTKSAREAAAAEETQPELESGEVKPATVHPLVGDTPIRLNVAAKTGGRVTKALHLVDGALIKESSACWIGTGEVQTIEGSLPELAEEIAALAANEAIILSNADLGEAPVPLTAKSHPRPGAVSRTRDFFNYTVGPALLLIDIDRRIGDGTPKELSRINLNT